MKLSFASSPGKSRRPPGPRKGIALITVLSLLAILTLLVITFLSLAKIEYVSANRYSDGIQSRALAEATTNLVIDQIWSATKQATTARKVESWVSQPGALRRYGQDGKFSKGYKLYSDSQMVVDKEAQLVNDAPPADWDTMPARYTDLNAPVVRPDESGGQDVSFPIVDPRAFYDVPDTEVSEVIEGFSYRKTIAGGGELNGVVTPGDVPGAPEELRLPMPVEWLYVLRDGAIGHLDNESNFVPANLVSDENPIVGRFGFWTDDESAKLNINTASEPTAWAPPMVYHELSKRWAMSQPAHREFQRYPGHPATTALSPVLYPNARMNYVEVYHDPEESASAARIKEQIYRIIPKINNGGSVGGTLDITPNSGVDSPPAGASSGYEAVDTSLSGRDRLYASLDELMLGADRLENPFPGLQEENDTISYNSVTSDVIERGQFFLTANSRAPETNIFNLPRVSMWPIHRLKKKNGKVLRSQFDEIIAFCSTANGAPYYIQRENADSPTDDVDIKRNKEVLRYLDRLTDAQVPGYGGSFGSDERYGTAGEKEQILAEIVDYIRSVNLHDDSLADSVVTHATKDTSKPPFPAEGQFGTYTNPRYARKYTTNQLKSATADEDQSNDLNAFAGHGQVTPGQYPGDAMGFGRFYTISEVALHFIASADAGDANEYADGGAHDEDDDTLLSWSNIPPLSGDMQTKIRNVLNSLPAGFDPESLPPAPNDLPPATFGNFKVKTLRNALPKANNTSKFWNYCLERDKPLATGRKKIQAAMLLEFFCPSAGWTQIVGDFHIRIKDLHNISIRDVHGNQPLFRNNEVTITSLSRRVNSYYDYGIGFYNEGSHRGGATGFRGFLRNRRAPASPPLPQDSGWSANDVLSYPLISNFFEVERGDKLEVTVDGPITIEIHGGTARVLNELQDNLVQTIEILFKDAEGNDPKFPSPLIVADHTESISNWKDETDTDQNPNTGEDMKIVTGRKKQVSYDPRWRQYWWTFNYNGLARPNLPKEQVTESVDDNDDGVPDSVTFGNPGFVVDRVQGRLQRVHDTPTANRKFPNGGNFIHRRDVVHSVLPWHGDYRLVAARKHVPADVFRPHHLYGIPDEPMAHNLVIGTNLMKGYGFDYGEKQGDSFDTNRRLVTTADYNRGPFPDFPSTVEAVATSNSYSDFDNGVSNLPDGAYINKPDEGNTYVKYDGLVPYLDNYTVAERTGETFFSPNRMIASPGVLGSLPTGVKRDIPWLTLLFRPPTLLHINKDHPGAQNPPDHLFLDLFWMPVVEPYAISEPFSTAGKVNLNYQMLPFRNITRATGLHGVMKGEIMRAIPNAAADRYLIGTRQSNINSGTSATRYMSGGQWHSALTSDQGVPNPWFYRINLEKTLAQFEERFDRGEVFRSASEICNVHLVPDNPAGQAEGTDEEMKTFWRTHALTGDNSREQPYTNIYPRLTTKSNTYRVHMRSQAIRKSSRSNPAAFDPDRDKVVGEYRGSTLIERYIDPADESIPDYAASNDPLAEPGLDKFYRIRVVSAKRFDP